SFRPQSGADPLGLPQHAEDVATGDLPQVLVRVAAIPKLLEERRVARDVLEPVRYRLHAVEVAPDAGRLDPGDVADVVDVIGDICQGRGRGRLGCEPRVHRLAHRLAIVGELLPQAT